MQSVKPASPVAAAVPFQPREPRTEEAIEDIVLAVKSALQKLKNLYDKITPIFGEYGFRAPSAGAVTRDLSEKVESSIIQYCRTFIRDLRPANQARISKRWEAKICKDQGHPLIGAGVDHSTGCPTALDAS